MAHEIKGSVSRVLNEWGVAGVDEMDEVLEIQTCGHKVCMQTKKFKHLQKTFTTYFMTSTIQKYSDKPILTLSFS
jgi:hypothetical protein